MLFQTFRHIRIQDGSVFQRKKCLFFLTDIQLFLLGSLLTNPPFVASIQSSFTSSLLFWCRKCSQSTDHLTSTTEKWCAWWIFIPRISDWSILFSEPSAGRRSTCTFICSLHPSLSQWGQRSYWYCNGQPSVSAQKKFFSCLFNSFIKHLLFELFDLFLFCVAFFCQNQNYLPYVQSLVLNKE